jgi:hypothetical protein
MEGRLFGENKPSSIRAFTNRSSAFAWVVLQLTILTLLHCRDGGAMLSTLRREMNW